MTFTEFRKRYLPTVDTALEKRRNAKRKQLPAHLRPRPVTPIYVQMMLNAIIFYSLINLMWNRDDVFSEGKAAAGIALCMFGLIYTMVQAVQLKRRYYGIRGHRRSKLNFWLMVIAFLTLPLAVTMFI